MSFREPHTRKAPALLCLGLAVCVFGGATTCGAAPQEPGQILAAGSESVSPADSPKRELAPGDDQSLLKGGVRGAALLTEDGLLKLEETSRDLQRASMMIMAEVTRKEAITVRGPNVLPNGIVIPAVPTPSGTVELGPLPARRNLVNQYLNQTTYYVQLLQNELDALIIPDEKAATIEKPWLEIRQQMASVHRHRAQLELLAEEPRLDNDKIGREALGIFDAMARVLKLRKQIARLIKNG